METGKSSRNRTSGGPLREHLTGRQKAIDFMGFHWYSRVHVATRGLEYQSLCPGSDGGNH